jgi:integrase
VSGALRPVGSVDDLFRLDPIERFQALITGPNFPGWLRAEPVCFDRDDPIFGYGCGIEDCGQHRTQAGLWCTGHASERLSARKRGIGDAAWKAAAVPFPARQAHPDGTRGPACRFCPDRDAAASGLCIRHQASLTLARKQAPVGFNEAVWAARQRDLPGAGPCLVPSCPARGEMSPALCHRHRTTWQRAGMPTGTELRRWLPRVSPGTRGSISLTGLPPLLVAEIRYGLWAHTKDAAAAKWHPMWLRTLARSCHAARVDSLMDLDPEDPTWTPQPEHVNRILKDLQADVGAVHQTRWDTRDLGRIDTNYWGFRFPDRRSPFDLTAISQRWLRDITWDCLADLLDGPTRPRTAGPVEQIRRSLVCLSAYLRDCDPFAGARPETLTGSTGKDFVADFTRRVAGQQPVRGVTNRDGSTSAATQITYALTMNAVRRVLRWALESGAAHPAGLPREFIVAFPFGGAPSSKNPRPFSDSVLAALSAPTNIALLDARDTRDGGVADIWSIQVRCGRRIGEVVNLRLDCVSEHLGRTWMWVDMTKVGKLDYAVQIPRDVYDLVLRRQAKTVERFHAKFGADPTAAQRRTVALFPSRVSNPRFERSITTSRFNEEFKAWICSADIGLPGHTTHQARHTLATRLIEAGASMAHVKKVLGHVSERMGESYVLIAGSQVEPFLQQVWVKGPGSATPGQVVLTPTEQERTAASQLMIDLAAVPTEHGLCTFKPVVGGHDCPFNRQCHSCEHFVITGADYSYWKRQEERWAAMAEGAPDDTARDYIYRTFEKSSTALAGLEKALLALGLLDRARDIDLRNPHQDFFDPIWRQGWRAGDLIQLGTGPTTDTAERPTDPPTVVQTGIAP